MTDAEGADDLNTEYRTRNRSSLSGGEALAAVDAVELNALSEGKQAVVMGLLGIQPLDPFGVPAQVMIQLFGGASSTISSLRALRVESVSRGVELGLGYIKVGHVQEARG